MSDEPDHDWLAWSLRDARAKVAAWPEWKREAFRVLPDEAPERRDGGAMSDETDPIEAWTRLDEGATPGPWCVGIDLRHVAAEVGSDLLRVIAHAVGEDSAENTRLIATDRTVRPELVAIVRAAARWQVAPPGTAEDASAEIALGEAVDALRVKLRATMGADRG